MNITIKPSSLQGSVAIIASKSLSHRYFIAASLSEETSTISHAMKSVDLEATIKALKSLGATIEGNTVKGGFPHLMEPVINASASGTTLRLLIPIAMLQEKPVVFEGKDRLPLRSLDVYEALFKAQGLLYERLSLDHLPVRVAGPLKPGTFRLRGNISSQFISGLLFALPLLEADSEIIVEEPFESRAYVALTLAVLNQFGIEILTENHRYIVPGKQHYKAYNTSVEGDYSQAAFFIVAGLINRFPLTLHNLRKDTLQGDAKLLDIVKAMKGNVRFTNDQLIVTPSQTQATTIDLANIPDLGPILMILAALSEGTTRFTNIQRLRYKESDRIYAMTEVLTRFGVEHTVIGNTMEVTGQKTLRGKQVFDSFNDHRIIMAIAVASIRADQPITILHVEHISKSYPEFFTEFTRLGGEVTIIKEAHHE